MYVASSRWSLFLQRNAGLKLCQAEILVHYTEYRYETPHRLTDSCTWDFVAVYAEIFRPAELHGVSWSDIAQWLLVIIYIGVPLAFLSNWCTLPELPFGSAYNKQNRHDFQRIRECWFDFTCVQRGSVAMVL